MIDDVTRETIFANLFLLVDPTQALEAAIERIAHLEACGDELRADLAAARGALKRVSAAIGIPVDATDATVAADVITERTIAAIIAAKADVVRQESRAAAIQSAFDVAQAERDRALARIAELSGVARKGVCKHARTDAVNDYDVCLDCGRLRSRESTP